MKTLRTAALTAITALIAAATAASFAESYRALYEWAAGHGLHGLWSTIWPLQVDVFIAVGELALFVALADSWTVRSRAAAWAITLAGLAVSVAGNVGHTGSHDWASRATAAVPPLAAAAALAVGLGVLKRVVAAHPDAPGLPHLGQNAGAPGAVPGAHPDAPRTRTRSAVGTHTRSAPARRTRSAPVTESAAEAEFFAELSAGTVPSLRTVRSRLHVGQHRAQALKAHMEELVSARTGPQ